ncbi:MAG: RDD family protein [Actinomycetota bacterium]
MTDENPAGYYRAEGDAPGTVRYWDGHAWVGDPQPIPDGGASGAPVDTSRYASVGARVAAALIDVGFTIAAIVAFAVAVDVFVGLVVVPLVSYVLTVVMTARLGGPPGKLIMGVRVTLADGVTSPPGLGPAFTRTVPAIVGSVPGLGGLLTVALNVVNVVFVSRDEERRSVHDRVGQTRVVRRADLG